VYLGYPSKISPYFIQQIQLDGLKIPYYPSTVYKQKTLVRRVSDVTCWEIFIVSYRWMYVPPFVRSYRILSAKKGLYWWMTVGQWGAGTDENPINRWKSGLTKTGLYRWIGDCRFFRSFDHITYVRRETDYIGECRSVGMYRVPQKNGSIGENRVPTRTRSIGENWVPTISVNDGRSVCIG